MIRSLLFFVLLLTQVGCHGTPLRQQHSGIELIVLGIAQDGGVPHLGCQKDCCVEARQSRLRLGPACLALVDHRSRKIVLLEATPAIEEQLSLLRQLVGFGNERTSPIDTLLLTHAHIGHYTGLIHFGREVASTDGVTVHCSERMASFLRENGPWSQLVDLGQIQLSPVSPGQPIEVLKGVIATPLSVSHRDEFSDTMAWRIEGPERTLVFCPDIDGWNDGILESLIEGADLCYLDATFYDGRELPGRDLSEIPHPPMVVTMDRLSEEAAIDPGRIRFIHLNHTNPALRDASVRKEIKRRGFSVAEVGERFRLD
ncbi:MAG: MBL fold metallo-hydrolase [Planctomycetota bacterium]|nr:MBL fold metallo-hydrolase [Planctomycetota bacterium]